VILLLEPLPTTLLSDRRLGHVEVSALAELKRIAESLAPALEGSGGTPIHGDFAPWNSTHVAGGRLAVWDWEETRLGSPLEDVFHWRIQRHLRGGDETLEEIVADAEGPGPETLAAARRLGVDPASAPLVLRSYFEHALGTPPRNGFPGVARVRAEGLARLTGVES